MKLLITALLLSISLLSFGQAEPEFGSVNVSTEKYNNKPIAIFSNHGERYYLNVRTNKAKFNYVLKILGGKTQGGYTESTYDLYDEQGRKLGLKVRHVIGYDYFKKKPVHTLTMLNSEAFKDQQDIELHLVAI